VRGYGILDITSSVKIIRPKLRFTEISFDMKYTALKKWIFSDLPRKLLRLDLWSNCSTKMKKLSPRAVIIRRQEYSEAKERAPETAAHCD
jgi:hypothetical protein